MYVYSNNSDNSASGTFTLNGGNIIGNTVTGSDSGSGGVYVNSVDNYYPHSTFTMTGGSIAGNYTGGAGGGGVMINYLSSFTMSGGKIVGNTAAQRGGGGVDAWSGTFEMTGGEIKGNKATQDGGGVAVNLDTAATFKVSGAPVISGNTKVTGESESPNNVHLSKSNGGKVFVTVTGPLTRGTTGAEIWISNPLTKDENFATGHTDTDTAKTYSVTATDAPCFHPDSGTLVAGVTTPSGKTGKDSTLGWGTPVAQRGDTKYISVQDAVNDTAASGEITMIADSTEPTVVVDKEITLDLAGFVLANNGTAKTVKVNGTDCDSKSVIFVASTGNLTVTDNSTTKKHYFMYKSGEKWVKTDTTSETPISAFDLSNATSGNSVYYVEGGCITSGTGI